MLKTPCAPCTSRADSSASRSAERNSAVPGFAFLSASAAATAISRPASQACAPKVETEPLPWAASYLLTYSSARGRTALLAGSCEATSTGPDGREVPQTSFAHTPREGGVG